MTSPRLGSTGRTAKALLVDDRKENLTALAALLQGIPVEPVSVTSGEAALKKLLVDDFAVIMLDAQMPEMDGFETASHIKARERTRHIPIIFLTAADRDAQLALRGYAAGAVDYLTKPVDPFALRAKVELFVDLWTKTNELTRKQAIVAEQEQRQQALAEAVDAALEALHGSDGVRDVGRAIEVLSRAQQF
ncbi:response regulator [Natronosporangium hydrolyticum]|uniref:Response regulator n=1 Tax=Natronosporangium hydrolyticum TaxID=2811111 RepID=A0A895YAV8_9ACTN|nr:response regulator [Natronosporangium hydrolyticum]QSB14904.1 response regulator [Natronosporangium hydrolyticum]